MHGMTVDPANVQTMEKEQKVPASNASGCPGNGGSMQLAQDRPPLDAVSAAWGLGVMPCSEIMDTVGTLRDQMHTEWVRGCLW
jgi:hypothetical protein